MSILFTKISIKFFIAFDYTGVLTLNELQYTNCLKTHTSFSHLFYNIDNIKIHVLILIYA